MDSSWNPTEGKLPVKIQSVNESDTGNYTCHVIAPVDVSGSVELIICKYCSANYISIAEHMPTKAVKKTHTNTHTHTKQICGSCSDLVVFAFGQIHRKYELSFTQRDTLI